ncbi:E3 ubiquitin-protein ligase rnf13 [Rhizopus azygosporus]|uniref:E3 ubiquitin-protein ligase rnf13 n=2 Tax=Rhizopus TaxID=4842 RepID=A0A367JCF5_RHIAZ|nr:hypothetical protein BCV71DRAFT_242006 [Rhizopus microsporus]RCH87565.1 E3 ubiquitin-protein ligase rnf13 [Rhizopus azygosporus]
MKLLKLLSFSLFPFAYASTHVTISNETFHDRIAAFGPRISPNGKLGFLAEPVSDPTGCSVVEPPCTDWIALVRRGGCSFISKVRAMQKSGATAVIVGDPDKRQWITMCASGDTSDIIIPSVFLAESEYKRILHLTQLFKSPLMIILQQEYTETINWPFVILFSPCAILLITYAYCKVRQGVKRRRQLSIVSNLGVKLYHDQKEEESCSICLQEYKENDSLRLLPCQHQFHKDCIDAWLLTQNGWCPICKHGITLSSA